MLPPRPLLGVWGCLLYPTLFSASWSWWLGFAPCSRWCPLSGCTSLRLQVLGVLGSLHCAPLTVGLLPGSPTLLCPLSAGSPLGLETSPSGEASASSCRFSWRPGAAGALAVTLPEAVSQREFFPLCLILPLPGSVSFSRICWRPCRSRSHIPSLAPSWWWLCPLLRWALLTLSGSVLGVPSAVSLRRSRCSIPAHCRPSCTMSFLTVSVISARFAFAEGRLPLSLVP